VTKTNEEELNSLGKNGTIFYHFGSCAIRQIIRNFYIVMLCKMKFIVLETKCFENGGEED
jgi:hypothetical protein